MPRWFGTDGIRGRVGEPQLAPDFVVRVGFAAGRVLARAHAGSRRPTVVIGKDTRVSGYFLEAALQAGFTAAGVDVLLTGPLPTPGVAYLTRALRLDAGVVVSASHNPYQDNGIKLFSAAGDKLSDAVEAAIEEELEKTPAVVSAEQLGKARRVVDAVGRYIEFCKATFPGELSLDGVRLVVDAANGAAYQAAPAVFHELGATVTAVGVEPNGFNINEGVGAVFPQCVAAAVARSGADYGIALDGDGDRVVMVDRNGRIFDGDALLYAIVRDRFMRGEAIDGVVGTVMTNGGLEVALSRLGIRLERTAVGDRYVGERLRQLGWRYGGEGSGHLLCLDLHTTGDGIVSALQVLAALIRHETTLAEWVADLVFFPQVVVNVPWPRGVDWRAEPVLAREVAEVERSLAGVGRVLVRPSGTEPKLRIMVEGRDEETVRAAADRLQKAAQRAEQVA
ncbi:MAG: phosphoglucosamine mutase [Hydrogenophilus sp.]|nr:phosphoglucosamine mutase [Hydrogenophilus sp.]